MLSTPKKVCVEKEITYDSHSIMELESFNLTDRNSEDKTDEIKNLDIMNPEEYDLEKEFTIENISNKFEDEFEILSILG